MRTAPQVNRRASIVIHDFGNEASSLNTVTAQRTMTPRLVTPSGARNGVSRRDSSNFYVLSAQSGAADVLLSPQGTENSTTTSTTADDSMKATPRVQDSSIVYQSTSIVNHRGDVTVFQPSSSHQVVVATTNSAPMAVLNGEKSSERTLADRSETTNEVPRTLFQPFSIPPIVAPAYEAVDTIALRSESPTKDQPSPLPVVARSIHKRIAEATTTVVLQPLNRINSNDGGRARIQVHFDDDESCAPGRSTPGGGTSPSQPQLTPTDSRSHVTFPLVIITHAEPNVSVSRFRGHLELILSLYSIVMSYVTNIIYIPAFINVMAESRVQGILVGNMVRQSCYCIFMNFSFE